MTTATQTKQLLPTGTYTADVAHSNANFEVEHAGVSIFRGGFKPIDAKLVSGENGLELEGGVSVEGISVDDENIRPHLLSPDFFDAERNPEIRFRSTEISGSPEDLRVAGELSMAGVSLPVEAIGRLRGPCAEHGDECQARDCPRESSPSVHPILLRSPRDLPLVDATPLSPTRFLDWRGSR